MVKSLLGDLFGNLLRSQRESVAADCDSSFGLRDTDCDSCPDASRASEGLAGPGPPPAHSELFDQSQGDRARVRRAHGSPKTRNVRLCTYDRSPTEKKGQSLRGPGRREKVILDKITSRAAASRCSAGREFFVAAPPAERCQLDAPGSEIRESRPPINDSYW